MKRFIIILFVAIVISFIIGFYIKNSENTLTGDRIIGITIIVSAFIFAPSLLYYRRNKTKLRNFEIIPKKQNSDNN